MNGDRSDNATTDTGVPDQRIKIAVIGCGLMGTRIAGELCLCGCDVSLYDNDQTALSTAVSRIHQDWEHLRTQGLLLNQHPQATCLICASSLDAAVEGAEFVLEAVVEDLQVKSELMRRISATCSETAVLGTNTLSLDITAMSEHVLHKQRLIGIRFLYPVYTIPEVEVTMGGNTDAHVLQRVGQLIEHLGKVLFVRTGNNPLVLTPQQVQSRQIAWKEKVQLQQRARGTGSHGGMNASSHARLIGIRFLYPVYTIPEVEVTMGGNTDAHVLQRVGQLIEHLGKVLFVRTGNNPLVLTPQQVQSRQIAWKEKVQLQQRARGTGSHGGMNASSHAVVGMLQHTATNSWTEAEDNRHTGSSTTGNDCIICTERERNCLLSPCNHLCCCMECAKSLTNRHQNCPMCRTPITEVLRVFSA